MNLGIVKMSQGKSRLDEMLDGEISHNLMRGTGSPIDVAGGNPQAGLKLPASLMNKILGKAPREMPTNAAPETLTPQPSTVPVANAGDEFGTPTPTEPQTLPEAPTMSQNDVVAELDMAGTDPLSGRTERRNINLSNVGDEGAAQMIELINKAEGGFTDIPQRQTQTNAETVELAKQAADDFESFNKKVSDQWQPEDLLMMRNRMTTLGAELQPMAKEIKAIADSGGNVPDDQLLKFEKLRREFVATQRLVSGKAAEAARLLQSLNIDSTADMGMAYYKDLAQNIEKAGGSDSILKTARAVADSVDENGLVQAAELGFWQKFGKFAVQARYNLMLSSVRSHTSNIAGGVLTGLYEGAMVKPVASAFNSVEYLARKNLGFLDDMPEMDRIRYMQELPTQMAGTLEGTKNGLLLASKILRGKELGEGKIYNEMGVKYSPEDMPESVLGKLGNLPTNLLEAEDALFRSVYYEQKIQELALRAARGTKNPDAIFRSLVINPTDDMLSQAGDFAKKQTFTNDPDLYGAIIGNMAHWAAEQSSNNAFFKVLVPFVKTPANIAGYAFDTTGLNVAIAPVHTLKKLKGTPEERAEVLSKITIAAGLYYLMHDYWADGRITGVGHQQYALRQGAEAGGLIPNSMIVGNYSAELARIEPLGAALGMIASTYDAHYAADMNTDKTTLVAAGVLSVVELMLQKNILSGVTDFVSLMEDPSFKKVATMGVSTAGSYVTPAILRDFREGQDKYKRDMIFDGDSYGVAVRLQKYFMNSVPYLSGKLPPQIDALGDYKKSAGNAFYRAFVPIRLTELKPDNIAGALLAYNEVPIGKPSHIINVRGTPLKVNLLQLDNQQGWIYMEYQRAVGKARKEALEYFGEKAWPKLRDQQGYIGANSIATKEISKLLSKATANAQSKFLYDLLDKKTLQPEVDGMKIGDPIELVLEITKDDLKDWSKAALDPDGDKETLDALNANKVIVNPKNTKEYVKMPDILKPM